MEEALAGAKKAIDAIPTRAELEAKDVFIITNSSKRICSLLGISKYTFYNYLDIVRKQREPYEKGKMED